MNVELLNASNHALTSAVNGLYQGMVLAGLVGLALRFLPGTNAATRHAIWLGTLLCLATLVPAHWCRDYLRSARAKTASGEANQNEARLNVSADSPQGPLEGAMAASSLVSVAAAQGPSREPALSGARVPEAPSPDDNSLPSPISAGRTETNPGQGWWTRLFEPMEFVAKSEVAQVSGVLLLAGWIAGTVARLMGLVFQLRRIRRLKMSSVPVNSELEELFRQRRASLEVTRPVDLRVSHQQRSPLVLGFLRPVILMPAPETLPLEQEQFEQIIAHELAHVRRRDDWLNLVQQLVQAALFFHPAVAWASRQLALEREIASDDLVLHQGGQPRAYARLLLNLASRLQDPAPRLAPGASTSRSQLQQRITMILNTHRSTSPRLAKARLGLLTSAAVLIAALALGFGPRLVLARGESPGQKAALPAAPNADLNAPPTLGPVDVAVALDVETSVVPVLHVETVLDQLDAPVIELVDANDENPPAPAAAESGPRFKAKPNAVPEDDSGAIPPLRPAPRRARLAEGASANGNIEERLDRLEKMVKELLAQQNPRRIRSERQLAELDAQKQMPELKALEQLKEMGKRGELASAEEFKRAAKEAEKAAKLDAFKWEKENWQEGFQAQIRILEKQRDALQRETEKLQRQIERIQREHERIQEKQQRDDGKDDDDAEPRPPKAPKPPKAPTR